MVLRSNPVSLLMAWTLNPCRFNSSMSLTSFPLNRFRHLLWFQNRWRLEPLSGVGNFTPALWGFYDRRGQFEHLVLVSRIRRRKTSLPYIAQGSAPAPAAASAPARVNDQARPRPGGWPLIKFGAR